MRHTFICLVAALPLSACAGGERLVETGMPRGSLAVAAIDRGDFDRAETLLHASALESRDPARLINLGYVYMEQGRHGAALDAWQRALAAPRHHEVTTMDGRVVRTDRLAREALTRHGNALASAR